MSDKENLEVTQEKQCIWMKAGVINMKLCPHNYACHLCAFDRALRTKGVKREGGRFKITWMDRLRRLSGPERYCRHMLQGLVTYKICPNDYQCGTCEYDQMVMDRIGDMEAQETRQIAGFRIAPHLHYHPRHSWVNVEYTGRCRVGMDDLASQVFGPDHEYVLPAIGKTVEQNKPFMQVKAAGKSFDLMAPLSGTVSVVNPLHSITRNLDPFSEGWLLFIEPGDRMLPNLKKLHYGEKALEWLSHSSDTLFESLTPGRKTAADGGLIAPEILGSLPPGQRSGLIESVVLA